MYAFTKYTFENTLMFFKTEGQKRYDWNKAPVLIYNNRS